MIDFIKLFIENLDISRISNNHLLEWDQTTSENTGEIKKHTAKYNGITFNKIAGKYLEITGSLHKHRDSLNGNGERNFSDFLFTDISETIARICQTFDLTPGQCIIENLEFGVNVIPSIPVPDILRSVINHKGKPFNRVKHESMYYLECTHWQYYVKMYHKGLQYGQGNILRFEIKTRKMDYVKTANIYTLADLLNLDNYNTLGLILKDNFNEILFYDPSIPETGINNRDYLVLTQGQIPSFWENLKKEHRDNYYKKLNRFRELIRKYGSLNLQENIGTLISQKWNELLNANSKTLHNLTGGQTDKKKPHFTQIDPSDKGTNCVNFISQDNPPPGEPQRRYCLTCGKDISKQRGNSKFCSAKYVGYDQAHKCRNDYYNPKNNHIQKMNKETDQGKTYLFDPVPFVNDPRLQQMNNTIMHLN